jgi:acetoin utilization deacetylase AcuC-like enzyme
MLCVHDKTLPEFSGMRFSQVNKTGFFFHGDCGKHEMGAGHPESPQRLQAIERHLRQTGVAGQLQRHEAPLASMADLELAHGRMHIASLRGLTDRLRDEIQAGGPAHAQVDPDTSINVHTWDAALRAAGAAVAAVDAVMACELDNAFCAVRPPGHHACRDQAMGFCFFNNVAVAARHALERHGLQRVAIVDFDVHHGNGTEDIVAGDQRILMVGFFQHPFYPYSGTTGTASNLLNQPLPANTRGDAVRALVTERWLPRLDAFKPELVIISAGFDAHQADQLGQMGLVEDDYAWMTQELQALAARHAKGRIVSCLEGGYNLDALARSVESHLRVLAGI